MSRSWFPKVDTLVLLGFLVLSVVFVGTHVSGYTKLSPIDELQHIDYLYQIPDPPDPTDKISQEVLHQQLCRGVDHPEAPPPGCQSGRLDPNTFQEKGYNTAAPYTPVYYTLTRVAAEVIEWVTPADNLLTAGRAAGALWLTLGLGLLYFAGRQRQIPRAPLVTVLVLLAASPAVLYPSATIAPDNAALAASGLLLLAVGSWEKRPDLTRALVLLLTAVLVTAVKMTYLVLVAAVAFYILLRWARRARRTELSLGPPLVAVLTGLTAVISSYAWTAYVGSLPQIPEDDMPHMGTQFLVPEFPWTGLGDSLLILVSPLSHPWVVVGSPQLTMLTTTLVATMVTAGVIAAGFFGAAPEPARDLARATLAAAVVGAAGFVVLSYVTAGTYVPMPTRYGIALVAPMVLSTAACLRTRSSVLLVAALTLVAVALTAIRLATLQ